MTSTDKYPAYVSIVASQRAQSHACTLYFATFTPGGKSGNDRLISGPIVTHMRNGFMKAAEMEPFYILVREEKASRIPNKRRKDRRPLERQLAVNGNAPPVLFASTTDR